MTRKQDEEIRFEPGNKRGWPKTQRQLDFAIYYVRDGLSQRAAGVKAGYSEKTVDRNSAHITKKMANFIAFLQSQKNDISERKFDASTMRVLREITALALSNRANYVRRVTVDGAPYWVGKPIDELAEEEQLAVEDYTIDWIETDDQGTVPDFKYKLYDKTQNIFMLGKHLGMFNEKIMLELSHREAQAKKVNFAELPTDQIKEMMETLEQFKQMAKDAAAIPSTATEVG